MKKKLEVFIQLLIIYSIITISLESVSEYQQNHYLFFLISEKVTVAIFIIEYCTRWYYSESRRRYPFSVMSLIDLAAILPSLLFFGFDLRGLRALRLFRILRILKMVRYVKALNNLKMAILNVKGELTVFLFLTVVLVYLASTGIYYAEAQLQPNIFSSIPACFWWAIVTLTTVGYGDMVPLTPLGKFFAGIVMLSGVGIVAVPSGLIASSFATVIKNPKVVN